MRLYISNYIVQQLCMYCTVYTAEIALSKFDRQLKISTCTGKCEKCECDQRKQKQRKKWEKQKERERKRKREEGGRKRKREKKEIYP